MLSMGEEATGVVAAGGVALGAVGAGVVALGVVPTGVVPMGVVLAGVVTAGIVGVGVLETREVAGVVAAGVVAFGYVGAGVEGVGSDSTGVEVLAGVLVGVVCFSGGVGKTGVVTGIPVGVSQLCSCCKRFSRGAAVTRTPTMHTKQAAIDRVCVIFRLVRARFFRAASARRSTSSLNSSLFLMAEPSFLQTFFQRPLGAITQIADLFFTFSEYPSGLGIAHFLKIH